MLQDAGNGRAQWVGLRGLCAKPRPELERCLVMQHGQRLLSQPRAHIGHPWHPACGQAYPCSQLCHGSMCPWLVISRPPLALVTVQLGSQGGGRIRRKTRRVQPRARPTMQMPPEDHQGGGALLSSMAVMLLGSACACVHPNGSRLTVVIPLSCFPLSSSINVAVDCDPAVVLLVGPAPAYAHKPLGTVHKPPHA